MSGPDRPSQPLPPGEPAVPATPRDSASVIVARDGARGLEVFMLQRHRDAQVAGGAYVFPGGTLDPGDADPALEELLDGWPGRLAPAMGEDETTARALVVCAIRETFEEAGILLARDAGGEPVDLGDAARWIEVRRRLQAGEVGAGEAARRGRVRLASDLLRFWARWITPTWAPRRYDTRFFVALMPPGQTPLHDDVEATDGVWVNPPAGVERALAGTFPIIFPTRKMLETLAPHATAAGLLAAAAARSPEPILPRIEVRDGEPRVVLPDGSVHAP